MHIMEEIIVFCFVMLNLMILTFFMDRNDNGKTISRKIYRILSLYFIVSTAAMIICTLMLKLIIGNGFNTLNITLITILLGAGYELWIMRGWKKSLSKKGNLGPEVHHPV